MLLRHQAGSTGILEQLKFGVFDEAVIESAQVQSNFFQEILSVEDESYSGSFEVFLVCRIGCQAVDFLFEVILPAFLGEWGLHEDECRFRVFKDQLLDFDLKDGSAFAAGWAVEISCEELFESRAAGLQNADDRSLHPFGTFWALYHFTLKWIRHPFFSLAKKAILII